MPWWYVKSMLVGGEASQTGMANLLIVTHVDYYHDNAPSSDLALLPHSLWFLLRESSHMRHTEHLVCIAVSMLHDSQKPSLICYARSSTQARMRILFCTKHY